MSISPDLANADEELWRAQVIRMIEDLYMRTGSAGQGGDLSHDPVRDTGDEEDTAYPLLGNNLSDIPNPSLARENLGITAANNVTLALSHREIVASLNTTFSNWDLSSADYDPGGIGTSSGFAPDDPSAIYVVFYHFRARGREGVNDFIGGTIRLWDTIGGGTVSSQSALVIKNASSSDVVSGHLTHAVLDGNEREVQHAIFSDPSPELEITILKLS